NLLTALSKLACVTPLGSREALCSDMDQTPSGLDRKGNEAASQGRAARGYQRCRGRATDAQGSQQVAKAGGPLVGMRRAARGTSQVTGRCGAALALFVEGKTSTAGVQLAAQLPRAALGQARIEQVVAALAGNGHVLPDPVHPGAGAARLVNHQGGRGIIQQADHMQ